MDRRAFLATALAATASPSQLACAQPAQRDKRTLFAISAMPRDGGIRLLRHFLSLTGKMKPRLLLIATAVGDDPRWIEFWSKQLVPQVECEFDALRLFGSSSSMPDHHARIMAADAIFVAGGNTLNALAVWRAQGIDASLREAWEKGIVLGGESAGMICWFEEGLSDSRPERLSVVAGLGWLPGSACPHFEQPERRQQFKDWVAQGKMKGGVGADGGTALLYRGTTLEQAISIEAASRVMRLTRAPAGLVESEVDAKLI